MWIGLCVSLNARKPNSTRIPEIDPQLILDESLLTNVEQSIALLFSLIAE